MKNWIFLLVIIILGILQVTLLDAFRVFNIKPDLLLISMVIANLIFDFRMALIFSVFAGAFKDAFGANAFGINTLLFSLWSFLLMKLSRNIALDDKFIRLGLVFIIALLHNIATGLVIKYLGNFVPLGIYLRIVFVASLYTALALPLVFKAIKPIYQFPR